MNNDQTPEEEVDIDEKTLTNEDDLEGTDDDEVESEKDYKVKFSESTRENQRIMTENKKLQEQLEALKNPDIKIKGKEADEAFYRKEGWKPQSYEDLQKAILEAEKRGKEGAVEYFKNQLDAQKKADEVIDNFIEEKSKEDKTFDEDTFFKFIKKINDFFHMFILVVTLCKKLSPCPFLCFRPRFCHCASQ